MIQSLKYGMMCVVLVNMPMLCAQNNKSVGYGIEEYPKALHEHQYIAMSDTSAAAKSLKEKLAGESAEKKANANAEASKTTPIGAQKAATTLKQPDQKSAAALKQEKAATALVSPKPPVTKPATMLAPATQKSEQPAAKLVTAPSVVQSLPTVQPENQKNETAASAPTSAPEQFEFPLSTTPTPQAPEPSTHTPESPETTPSTLTNAPGESISQLPSTDQMAPKTSEEKKIEQAPDQISEAQASTSATPEVHPEPSALTEKHELPGATNVPQSEPQLEHALMPATAASITAPVTSEISATQGPVSKPQEIKPEPRSTMSTQSEKSTMSEPGMPSWTMPTLESTSETATSEKIEAAPEEQLTIDELSGIDTSELEEPQGNWLYKRIWWERAEAKYEKLRAAVSQVFEARMKFFSKRSEIDRTIIDPFFVKVGVSQGELASLVEQLIAQIEQEQKAHDVDDEKNKALLEKLEQDKADLEETLKSVQLVIQMDGDIDQALVKLMEQINRMRSYEQQAWSKFKEIARTLDDKKARIYYYEIDGAWKNVKEIQNYIVGNFNSSFGNLVTQLQNQIKNIDGSLQTLKERGIDLKKQSDQLTRTQHDQAMKAFEVKQQEEQELEEQEPEEGFFATYLINPVRTLFSVVTDGIKWPFKWLLGWSATEEPEEDDDFKAQKSDAKPEAAEEQVGDNLKRESNDVE